MRPIGEIKDEAEAKRFGDYLYANEIHCDVDEDEDCWTIWIHDDDQIAKAESELAEFLKTPGHPRYTQASARAEKIRQDEAKEEERATRRQVDVRTEVFSQSAGVAPTLTFFIIGLCVLIHLMKTTGRDLSPLYISQYGLNQTIINSSVKTGEEVRRYNRPSVLPEITGQEVLVGSEFQSVGKFQIWRLVTPIFMHGSLLHILFNMYWLYFLGSAMESRLGLRRFAGFILIAAILSNIGQYIAQGPFFLGMSGVNYGLFGYLWIRGKNDPNFGIQLDQSTIAIMLIWLVVCFTGLVGNVANVAHTLGLIVGVAAGWLAAQRAR